MKLGIGSYTYPWHVLHGRMSALALLDEAAVLGVDVIQVCDNLPLVDLPEADLDRLCRSAQSLRVRVEVGTRGLTPDNVRAHLPLCRRLQSPILRMVIDQKGHEPTIPDIVAIIRSVLLDLAHADVTLAIENHDRFRARELRHVIESVGSERVGICLDGANSLGAGEDIYTVMDQLAPYVVNLHVKDFSIRRLPSQLGFIVEGQPSGDGMLDLAAMLPRLPPSISAIVELWVPEQQDVDTTLALERQWAARSVHNMRRRS